MAKIAQFPTKFNETMAAIEQYKADVEAGLIKQPCIPHFLGRIGASTEEFLSVVMEPCDENKALSRELKKFGTWIEGEMVQRMGGPNSSKLIFLLKQGFSGYRYTDKVEQEQSGTIDINVSFNGKAKHK